MNIKLLTYNVDLSKLRIYYNTLFIGISHHAQNHARKLTIILLLPRPFLLSPSPSPSGTSWTRSRLPRAYLSKMAESALSTRAKIRPPCTLKHRVQQEYNSLLVNALNRFFKSNLSLNNFKWLLTNWSFRAFEILYPFLENASEMDTPF